MVSKPQTATNPFYVMLVIVGVAFVVTAFAYFTMTVRAIHAQDAAESGLTTLVAEHGLKALIVELALLAVATFGAIGTDSYWTRKSDPPR